MDPSREELEAMLADYVDGNLSGEELARAETFLAANPGVRDVMARLMVDSEAIRTLPRVAPPVADVSEDLRGGLERDMLLGGSTLPVTQSRQLSTPALAIAAMLVVALGVGAFALKILSDRPQPPVVAVRERSTSAAPPGQGAGSATRRSAVASPAAKQERVEFSNKIARSVADGGANASADVSPPSNGGASPMAQSAVAALQVADRPLPPEVAGWIAVTRGREPTLLADSRRQAIVLVVDRPTSRSRPALPLAAAAREADGRGSSDQVDAIKDLAVARPSVPANEVANATMPHASAGSHLNTGANPVVSNVVPSPIGEAIRDDGDTPNMEMPTTQAPTTQATMLADALSAPIEQQVYRDLPQAAVAALQADIERRYGATQVAVYALPAESPMAAIGSTQPATQPSTRETQLAQAAVVPAEEADLAIGETDVLNQASPRSDRLQQISGGVFEEIQTPDEVALRQADGTLRAESQSLPAQASGDAVAEQTSATPDARSAAVGGSKAEAGFIAKAKLNADENVDVYLYYRETLTPTTLPAETAVDSELSPAELTTPSRATTTTSPAATTQPATRSVDWPAAIP